MVQAIIKGVFISIFTLSCLACTHSSSSKSIHEAQHLLWTDAKDCMSMLDSIEPTLSSEQDRMDWHLCHEHAQLREYRWINSDSLLHSLSQYFIEKKDYHSAGEACYLIGTYHILHNEVAEATFYLKDAEHYLQQAPAIDPNLMGITLYRLGNAFEDDHLYDMAATYYKKALPYMLQCHNDLYSASCYRDIALRTVDMSTEHRLAYLDSALAIFEQIPNTQLEQLDIQCRRMEQQNIVSQQLIDYYKTLCNAWPSVNNAQPIATYYLQQHQWDSCYKYMKILEQDTCYSEWSKENYLHLSATYHQQKADYKQAMQNYAECYHVMRELLYHKVLAQTIVTSQQYDLTKQKEQTMQTQIQRQHERLILAGIIILLSLLAIVVIVLYYNHKIRSHKQIQQQLTDIIQLTERNATQQKALKKNLQSNIQRDKHAQITAHMSTAASALDTMPHIRQQFELIYNNRLESLCHSYSGLTEADINAIMLTVLGYGTSDCCILLNISKNTLWQRHKRIKQRLGLSAQDNLQTWLQQYFNKQ